MLVDNIQLFEVVSVRSRALCVCRIRACVRKVVHASILRAAVGGLMIEPEGVSDLLTHHVQPLVRIVVLGSVKVRVVHLGRALRDVGAASDVNRSHPEPAIIAVSAIADLRGSRNHRAALVRLAGNERGQYRSGGGYPEYRRAVPVARRLPEMPLPVGRCQVIAKLQREWRSRPRPVVAAP